MPARRTCVVTRTEADRDALIRIVAHPLDGSLVVDPRGRLGGRGAWVTPTAEALRALEARPGLLVRPLRLSAPPDTSGLLDQLRALTLRAVEDGLSQARAGSALVAGHDVVVEALGRGQLAVVALASDTAERTASSVRRAAGDAVSVVVLPLDRQAIGQRLGTAPKAVVGVLSAAASTHLRRQLRRLADLG